MGWNLLQIVCGSQNGKALAGWRGGVWQEFLSTSQVSHSVSEGHGSHTVPPRSVLPFRVLYI